MKLLRKLWRLMLLSFTLLTKKWIEIPDADHDNVLVTAYPTYADIAEWMLAHVPAR